MNADFLSIFELKNIDTGALFCYIECRHRELGYQKELTISSYHDGHKWNFFTLLFSSGGLNRIPPKSANSFLHLSQIGFIAIFLMIARLKLQWFLFRLFKNSFKLNYLKKFPQ
jgi:hypothetical protein